MSLGEDAVDPGRVDCIKEEFVAAYRSTGPGVNRRHRGIGASGMSCIASTQCRDYAWFVEATHLENSQVGGRRAAHGV
jgi:hypothetical protein